LEVGLKRWDGEVSRKNLRKDFYEHTSFPVHCFKLSPIFHASLRSLTLVFQSFLRLALLLGALSKSQSSWWWHTPICQK
jgi:hypothetical protein